MKHFGRVFTALPLCAIVDSDNAADRLFIVHGSPPSDPNVGVEQIAALDRSQYVTSMSPDAAQQAAKPTLIQELLWSDPVEEDGVHPSERGIGWEVGPDVIARFLKKEGCGTVVRSHEAVEEGVELLFECPEGYRLYTVFSASNYGDGSNDAGVLRYTSLPEPTIHRFRTTPTPSSAEVHELHSPHTGSDLGVFRWFKETRSGCQRYCAGVIIGCCERWNISIPISLELSAPSNGQTP